MTTLASWQNSLFIQQVLHPEARMDFDDNAVGLQGGGLNDSFLGLVCTYPGISTPSMLISNVKTTGLSEYSTDDSIASIQNPTSLSFSSLMDPYSFTLYVKGLLQSNTIESGTFTAPVYTDPNPWLYYTLLKPMNNSNVIDVDRESFEYWGAIPGSLSINGTTGDVMKISVEYLALRTDRTNVIGKISNEPRLVYKAGDVGNTPSGIDVYRESTYNSYSILDASPAYVSNDSDFTNPNHLSIGNVEISNSTGHLNFSQSDLYAYEDQNIIIYYSKSERQEYYKDKRIGFPGNVVPFKFQDLIASINGETVELTKIGLNIRNNISANYYDRQGGYKWILRKLTGVVSLSINWGDSVVGGAEGVYEYFKGSHHALSFYWGSSSPDEEGEAKIVFDGKIKSIAVNESKGELHSDVVFEIAKNLNSFKIEVGIDEDKLQSTTTSTTSTSTTSTSTTSTSTSVTGTSSTSTTSTSSTSTSTTSTSTSSTTSTSTSSSTSSTSTTTTLPSLVETDIGAAGDYTTVAAWVAGEQGDFVGNGQTHKGNLIDANLNVTATTSITGATTDEDHYWWLTSDSVTRRHTGGEGTGASLTASSYIGAAALLQSDDDIRIDFIEIDCNNNVEKGIRIYGGNLWVLIDGNIVHGAGIITSSTSTSSTSTSTTSTSTSITTTSITTTSTTSTSTSTTTVSSTTTTPDSAATHYIRAGATGADDGSSWTDAWTDLPSTFTRGHVYYVADGTYGGHTFSTATSGSTYIYIFKAHDGEHGAAPDWDSSYGDGTAEFYVANLSAYSSVVIFSSSYWVFDGKVGSGVSGHGFKVSTDDTDSVSRIIMFTGSPSYIDVLHTDCEQSGEDGLYNSDVIYCNTAASYITFKYCHFHDVTRNIFTVSGGSYWTLEYSVLQRNHNEIDIHQQMIQGGPTVTHNFVIRYNKFVDGNGTGYIVPLGGTSHHHWWVYGNLFYSTNMSRYGSPSGLFGDTNTTTADYMYFYNNTIVDIGSYDAGVDFHKTDANEILVYNNLWYNCSFGGWNNITGKDYNAAHVDLGEDHDQIITSSIFSNYSGDNFYLSGSTDAGTSLSPPFNQDMDGNTRGADGNWDRGAFEYDSS